MEMKRNMKKTPKFWYAMPNVLQKIFLYPLMWIYFFVQSIFLMKKYKLSQSTIPVIAVGGATVGGSGKTPIAIALSKTAAKCGYEKIFIVTRGYGRKTNNTFIVNKYVHHFYDVGDEALELVNFAKVIVTKNREDGFVFAKNLGADFVILDDGLSQRQLEPTCKLLVIDSLQKFGNEFMMPLGPLRHPIENMVSSADVIVIVGEKFDLDLSGKISSIRENANVTFGEMKCDLSCIKSQSEPLLIFCGLGFPQKFFNLFEGFNVVKMVEFPDHYPYCDDDIEKLLIMSNELNAHLVTTKKDMVKISEKYQNKIYVVGVEIIFQKEEDILKAINQKSAYKESVAHDM